MIKLTFIFPLKREKRERGKRKRRERKRKLLFFDRRQTDYVHDCKIGVTMNSYRRSKEYGVGFSQRGAGCINAILKR